MEVMKSDLILRNFILSNYWPDALQFSPQSYFAVDDDVDIKLGGQFIEGSRGSVIANIKVVGKNEGNSALRWLQQLFLQLGHDLWPTELEGNISVFSLRDSAGLRPKRSEAF